jgi:histidinol-phosphate aminotransferase
MTDETANPASARPPNGYWSPVVHRLTPYVPGEQPKLSNLVKLNTNENPYGPSPRVLDAIRAELSDALRLYPDPNAERLKQAIADYYGVAPAQVFVGNGSDEVLAHIFQALFQHPAPLLFPDITYSFYPVYCGLYGIDFTTIPLAEDFTLRSPITSDPTAALSSPIPMRRPVACCRWPTSNGCWTQPDSVVVIDEAYIDFGGDTAIDLVNRYPNLLVTQTLSKSRSLAGLRVGLAVGHAELDRGAGAGQEQL